MHNTDLVRILNTIRNSHPDVEELYMEGQCYNLHLIIKSIYPQAVAYYSRTEGHVYTRLYGFYYDIRGVHLKPPEDIAILDHQRSDPPHRWGDRDARRLVHPRELRREALETEKEKRQMQRKKIAKIISACVIAAFIVIVALTTDITPPKI